MQFWEHELGQRGSLVTGNALHAGVTEHINDKAQQEDDA
jgi:hypothetical protein